MTSNSSVVPWNRRAQIRWMNQTLYHEVPLDFEEVVSVTTDDSEIGYCDCCDEKTILTRSIVTFAEEKIDRSKA